MRNNLVLFIAVCLGCLLLSTIVFRAQEVVLATLFPDSDVVKVAQCTRLLETYHDGHKSLPQSGTPESAQYYDCYVLICGRKPDV